MMTVPAKSFPVVHFSFTFVNAKKIGLVVILHRIGVLAKITTRPNFFAMRKSENNESVTGNWLGETVIIADVFSSSLTRDVSGLHETGSNSG